MATTWEYQNKESGTGWDYNQNDLTYNETPNAQGQAVTYNAVGSATVWTLQNES